MGKPTMEDLRGAFRSATRKARREIVVPKPKIVAPKPGKKARSKPPKWKTIKCARCGIEVSTMKGSRRKYCPDCAKEAVRENNRRYYKHMSRIIREPTQTEIKREMRQSRIDEIQRSAHAAGMSYGKYKAMLAIQEMRKPKAAKKRKKGA